jgi:hypothetical protein
VNAARRQRRVVLVLTALCIARGLFWAVVAIAPSPIDEMQHFDYVRSLARGDGVPTVGKDTIGDEVLEFAKESRTFIFRSLPYPQDVTAEAWVGADPQYEGIQGPTYYALLVPFYWLGRPFGISEAFYLSRIGSVLLGAAVVPLAWLLTRRLLPNRPSAWLLPSVVLAFLASVNAGTATIGNDAVVLTGAAAAAVLLLRVLERRTVAGAVAAGGLAGLVLLGKTTASAMVPVLLLLALPQLRSWWREGAEARARLRRWIVAYAAAFAAPFAVWTGWNVLTYHAFSGAAEAEKLTGALQTSYPRSLHTLWLHLQASHVGLSTSQLADVQSRYHLVWEVALLVLVALAAVVAWRRRDGETGWTIGWGAAAVPLTFLTVAGSFLLVLGETGLILGRYLWVAVVPAAVALGVAASVVAGRRFAIPLVLAVAALAAWQERADTYVWLERHYEGDLPGGGVAPVVDQSWNDGYAQADAVRIDVACLVSVVDIGLEEPPEQLTVAGTGAAVEAQLESAVPAGFARYRLPVPVQGPVRIPLGTGVAVSNEERVPEVSLDGGAGDPMVRADCPAANPGAVRFAQVFAGHPGVGRGAVRAWPTVQAAGLSVGALVSLGWGLRRRPEVSGSR